MTEIIELVRVRQAGEKNASQAMQSPAWHGKKKRRRGAPPLACNLWLEEQLARLPDPNQYLALYRPWLARYFALRGYYPHDPRRSFRAAVAGARSRLQRR